MKDVVLYSFPGSNAGLSVELLLDHAGVEYRLKRLRPGLHVASLKARGFPKITVPAARIDGMRVQGSRRIARVVADALPNSGLLPADPDLRETVLDAERDGERLQVAARRLVYVIAQDEPSAVRPLVDENYGFVPRPLRPFVARGLIAAAKRGHRAHKSRVDRELDVVSQLLDRFDELVEQGVLGTDTPTIADFQIAPNLALLAAADNIGPILKSRSSWKIATRVVPRYPLDIHVEAPVTWLDRLRDS